MALDGSLVVAANNVGTCYVWRMMRGASLTTHFEPLHKLRAHAGTAGRPHSLHSKGQMLCDGLIPVGLPAFITCASSSVWDALHSHHCCNMATSLPPVVFSVCMQDMHCNRFASQTKTTCFSSWLSIRVLACGQSDCLYFVLICPSCDWLQNCNHAKGLHSSVCSLLQASTY